MAAPTNPDPWLLPTPVPVGTPAEIVQVYRFNLGTLTLLPSVRCLHIEQHSGPDPGKAAFRYDFGNGDPLAPQSLVDALSSSVNLPETIAAGDTLAVQVTRWDGVVSFPFYGTALEFSGQYDKDSDEVIIEAVGIAKRLWDTPIPGLLIRDSSNPTAGKDFQTDLVAQFNPKGLANSTDKGSEVVNTPDPSGSYPTFLDPGTAKALGIGRQWTLATAASYLCWSQNGLQQFVNNPSTTRLNALLVAKEPIRNTSLDPTNPATYKTADIIVSDKPITGRDWPTALHELIRSYGFDFRFQFAVSGKSPTCTMVPYARQEGPVKALWLQPDGTAQVDPALSNMAEMRIGRDLNEVVNSWEVHGAIEKYECSFLLRPGFAITASDALAANLPKYKKGSDHYKLNPDDYRLFVFDESGEGHWEYTKGALAWTKLKTATKLVDSTGLSITGNTPYDLSIRRRKPYDDLISRLNGRALKAKLSVTIGDGYSDGPPILQPSYGFDWIEVNGGWSLLPDRIGFRVTIADPNAWNLGNDKADGSPRKLNLVEQLAQGGTTVKTQPADLVFMLTCVIEGDLVCKGTARRQVGSTGQDPSPLSQEIKRTVDARDRFKKEAVHPCSEFSGPANLGGQDDTTAAIAEATSYRSATEAGVLSGQAVIPYFTDYYQIGDRIQGVSGRALGFRTDGGGSGNVPVYPMVEGIRYDLDDGQTTTLYLSDESTTRRKLEKRNGKR